MSDDDPTPSVEGPSVEGPSVEDPSVEDPAFDEVRALLSDARVTEPVPAEVAARLDATLAALQEERRAEAVVVPLRRRRTAARVLVAAAAVVVVTAGGVGIAQVAQQRSGSSADTAAAGSAEDESATSGSPEPSAPEALPGAPSAVPPAKSQVDGRDVRVLPAFTSARFAEQAATFDPTTRRFSTDSNLDGSDAAPTPTAADAPMTTGRSAAPCAGPSIPGTTSVPILFDGAPAVLVVHETTGGTQEVDAYSCDGTQKLATTSVPR